MSFIQNTKKFFLKAINKFRKGQQDESAKKISKIKEESLAEKGASYKGQPQPAWWKRLYGFKSRAEVTSNHLQPIPHFGTFSPVPEFSFKKGSAAKSSGPKHYRGILYKNKAELKMAKRIIRAQRKLEQLMAQD